MRCRRILTIAATGALALACTRAPTQPTPGAQGGRRVLFIGNSLTYANDLPSTVAAIAASVDDTVRVATVAGAGVALIDHAKSSQAVSAIRNGGWEYVVLQQGPTPRGICRDTLVLAATMLAPHIRAVSAQPALFMPWSAVNGLSWADDVATSFQNAAAAVDGVFMPAGAAWRIALAEDPQLPLYAGDNFHPANAGTFLAALVIYERISGRDARTLPAIAFASGRRFSLPEATIRLLQRAAHEANDAFPANPAPAPSAGGQGSTNARATTC